MSNDPTDTILDYMKSLRNSMMFGRCAGKTTRLSKLHQNRLVSEETRTIARNELYRLANILTSALVDATSGDEDREIAYLDFSNETRTFLREINQFFTDNPNMLTETKLPNQDILDFKAKSQEIIDLIQPESLLRFEAEFLELVKKFQGLENLDKKSTEKLTKLVQGSINRKKEYSELRGLLERLSEKKNVLASLQEEIAWSRAVEDDIRIEPKRIREIEAREEISRLQAHLKFTIARADLTLENLPLFQYYSLLRENATLFHNTEDKFCNEATYGTISLIDNVERLQSENGGLISILGDPGWGKTIQLRQFTHEFLTEQIQERNTHQIPIYVKAKTLSKHIRNLASSHYGFAVDLPGGGVVEHNGKTTRHVGETNQILIRAMLETESDLSKEQIRNLFEIQRSVAKNMILIVDAYDEVPTQDARFEVVNFISDQVEHHAWPVIMTCRNSHEEELETVFKEMNNGVNPHHKYKIHFTNEELQFLMPTKLANAWGMNSDQISHTVALEFEAFKNVLTHPLFVGLFCMLKSEGAELSVLDIELNSEDRMSIHHISFLKQVIDFGLKINIKDRKSITDEDEKTIRMAFLYIAAIHLTMGINNLDNILTIMKKLHNFTINEKHGKILAENLGVMFVNGEKEIEWTHKTLPEVALGLLLNENQDFVDFLGDIGGRFGKNDDLWSECLFLTVIEDDLIAIHNYVQSKEQMNQKNILEKCYEIFPTMNRSIIHKSLKLLGLEGQLFQDVWLDESTTLGKNWRERAIHAPQPNLNSKSWSFRPTQGTEFEMELRNRLGNTWFLMMYEGNPFTLPVEFFGNELNKSEDGLFATLFRPSNYGDIQQKLYGFENLEWPTFLARELDVLTRHMPAWDLTQRFFKNLMLDNRFFPRLEEKAFCRELKNLLELQTDLVEWEPSQVEMLELILVCVQSNPHLDLLNTFLSCDELHPESDDFDIIDNERDNEIYSEITKHILHSVDRGDAAPGKISLSYLKQKHRLVHEKFIRVLFDVMLTRQYIPGIKWLDDEIFDLKIKWGIPEDFELKITEDSSKFDKIQSLDIGKIPDTILRYILGNIE